MIKRLRAFKNLTNRWLQPARDACALQRLSEFGIGYVPWTGAAMRPESVMFLVNEILINRRCSVLELGSGISTVYMAAAIAQLGSGHVDSIDQDQGWINVVSEHLVKNNLDSFVTFHHAPLVERTDIQWPKGFQAVPTTTIPRVSVPR